MFVSRTRNHEKRRSHNVGLQSWDGKKPPPLKKQLGEICKRNPSWVGVGGEGLFSQKNEKKPRCTRFSRRVKKEGKKRKTLNPKKVNRAKGYVLKVDKKTENMGSGPLKSDLNKVLGNRSVEQRNKKP